MEKKKPLLRHGSGQEKISPFPIKKSVLKTLTPNDFGAVLEDIRDKFTVMVEGLEGLRGEFYTFRDDMNGFRKETKSSFASVLEYLSRIDDELKEVKEEISRLNKDKAEQEYAKSIEGRVQKIQFELLAIRNELSRKKT
jgi:hypothetical protein